MGRTTGTASVADLIQRGLLRVGDRLILRRRNKPNTEAVLTSDSSLRVGRDTYSSPSAAAKAVLGGKPAQGWDRWHVVRLDNVTLATVRKALDD